MTKALFLFKSDGDHDKHTLLTGIEDEAQADELINDGKATYIDLGDYTDYRKEASQIHSQFEADVRRIKESDNPLLQNEDVQRYEIDKLEQQYEADNQRIKEEYEDYRKKQIEEARTRAAQATIRVTEDDRLTAEQFKNRAALSLASASDKSAELSKLKSEINLLTDEQRTALQGEIVGLLAGLDGNESGKRAVIEAVQDIRNQDLLSLKIAEQLPRNPTIEYDQRRVIKDTMNDRPSALRDGGISKEFYEKHLKEGRK